MASSSEHPINRVDGVMKSTVGNHDLYCKYWKPQAPWRGLVFLNHGYAEYSEYHENLAQALYKESYYVFTHDHLGHGRSEGVRGYIQSVDQYANDVLKHFQKVEDEEDLASIPYFMTGLSMGGTIAIRVAMMRPQMFRGVVLLSPAVTTNPEMVSPCTTAFANVIGKFFPYFPIAPIEYNAMSRDKAKSDKMAADELCLHGNVKAGWAVAMLNAFNDIVAGLPKIEWPFMLLQGDADTVVGTQGAKLFVEKTNSKDKTFKIYEGAYHDLLQELDYVVESVLKVTPDWMSERAGEDGAKLVKSSSEVISEPRQEKAGSSGDSQS